MSLVSAMAKSTCTPTAIATRVPRFCSLQTLATAAADTGEAGSPLVLQPTPDPMSNPAHTKMNPGVGEDFTPKYLDSPLLLKRLG